MKQTQVDKEQLAVTIADKLGKYSGVSYHSIAEMAANSGRIQLAIKVWKCNIFMWILLLVFNLIT